MPCRNDLRPAKPVYARRAENGGCALTMAAMLSLAFFLSGAAALLFETLWLRRAGLMLGSSVWASSIVLAAFMTGLAVGNAVAVRWAARIRRPLHAYALLEIGAGVAGTAVV